MRDRRSTDGNWVKASACSKTYLNVSLMVAWVAAVVATGADRTAGLNASEGLEGVPPLRPPLLNTK